MPTPWFASLLRCPQCRKSLRWNTEAPSCSSCDATFEAAGESVLLPTSGGSVDWAAMQDGSVERYEAHHYNLDTTIPRLFGGFIATTLDRDVTVHADA